MSLGYLGYMWGIPGRYLGGCLVDILLISGGYLGQVCISWAYIGDILGIYWGYHGHILRISCGYQGDIMGIY